MEKSKNKEALTRSSKESKVSKYFNLIDKKIDKVLKAICILLCICNLACGVYSGAWHCYMIAVMSFVLYKAIKSEEISDKRIGA